jgi:hypothetical protein
MVCQNIALNTAMLSRHSGFMDLLGEGANLPKIPLGLYYRECSGVW